jgi:hypothetical protein
LSTSLENDFSEGLAEVQALFFRFANFFYGEGRRERFFGREGIAFHSVAFSAARNYIPDEIPVIILHPIHSVILENSLRGSTVVAATWLFPTVKTILLNDINECSKWNTPRFIASLGFATHQRKQILNGCIDPRSVWTPGPLSRCFTHT